MPLDHRLAQYLFQRRDVGLQALRGGRRDDVVDAEIDLRGSALRGQSDGDESGEEAPTPQIAAEAVEAPVAEQVEETVEVAAAEGEGEATPELIEAHRSISPGLEVLAAPRGAMVVLPWQAFQ